MKKIISVLTIAAIPTFGFAEDVINVKSQDGMYSKPEVLKEAQDWDDVNLKPETSVYGGPNGLQKKTEEPLEEVIQEVEVKAEEVVKPEPLPEEQLMPEVKEDVAEDKSVNEDSGFGFSLSGVQVGAGFGTTGTNFFAGYANLESEYWLLRHFGFRADIGTTDLFDISMNTLANEGLNYVDGLGDIMEARDTKMKAEHLGVLVDFYPFSGSFRISGGYLDGNTNFNSVADITALDSFGAPIEFELSGTQYRYDATGLAGNATFNWDYSGPYLGTGFDIGMFAGFKFFIDAGVVLAESSGKLDLTVPETGLEVFEGGAWEIVETDPVATAEFERLKNEALKDANQDLEELKVYPILKMGFMYRF